MTEGTSIGDVAAIAGLTASLTALSALELEGAAGDGTGAGDGR